MLHKQSELLVLDTPALPGFSERAKPLKTQLLKWVGNKQKQAPEIIKFFPTDYDTYIEPFLGSGGVLGVLSAPFQEWL
jgi:DNA adenine methylase